MPEELLQDNPLVVIGDEDVVLGFHALGLKAYAVKEQKEFKLILEEIVREKSAVCLVQDNIYTSLQNEIDNYRSLPLHIFIPFAKGAKNTLLDNLVKDIRLRATGTF